MKYFLYSRTQHNSLTSVALKNNMKYIIGTIYTKGSFKRYTEIVDNPKNSKYSDSIIVHISNNIESENFTEPNYE